MSEPASKADINRLAYAVQNVSDQQLQIAGAVGEVAAAQRAARSELGDLRLRFESFLHKDALAKNLLKAQNSLQLTQDELRDAYGHYDEVRRQATGILQALDAGIVTRSTIYHVTEEFMIGTPRYWLAPALVALAAWVSDDRVLAERALAEAVRREPGKTSLFFTLVLRRNGRTGATARWLRQYVVGQDPAALPREFTVVLDAVATGAFGPEARPVVLDHLAQWYEQIRADEKTVEAQITRWEKHIDGMRGKEQPTFPVLKEISPTWPELRGLYAGATAFAEAGAYFHRIFDGPLPVTDLNRRVDDILDKLVSKYDDEEQPLRTRMAELQAVIAHDGDEEAAAKDVKAQEPLRDERFDVMTLLTNAAFFPDQVGASLATQRLAVAVTGEWAIEATARLEKRNKGAVPDKVELSIDGWHGAIDGSSTEASLVGSVTRHIHERTERAVANTGIGAGGVLTIVAGVAALVFAVVSAVAGGLGAAVFLLVLMTACGVGTYLQFQRRDRLRDNLRAVGEQQRKAAAAKVNGAIAEARDWWDLWQRELANANQLRAYLSALVRDAHHRPAHAREVLD
jgi:hypothetical protein